MMLKKYFSYIFFFTSCFYLNAAHSNTTNPLRGSAQQGMTELQYDQTPEEKRLKEQQTEHKTWAAILAGMAFCDGPLCCYSRSGALCCAECLIETKCCCCCYLKPEERIDVNELFASRVKAALERMK